MDDVIVSMLKNTKNILTPIWPLLDQIQPGWAQMAPLSCWHSLDILHLLNIAVRCENRLRHFPHLKEYQKMTLIWPLWGRFQPEWAQMAPLSCWHSLEMLY